MRGQLKRWNDDRGFGFIIAKEVDEDVFVHVSAFPKGSSRPIEGDELTFTIVRDDKGPRAVNVQFVSLKKP